MHFTQVLLNLDSSTPKYIQDISLLSDPKYSPKMVNIMRYTFLFLPCQSVLILQIKVFKEITTAATTKKKKKKRKTKLSRVSESAR